MSPDEKDLMEKTFELAKENNHILRGIRRSNRWSIFFRVFYWLVIVGISVGAFVYIQPYLNPIFKAYQNVQSSLNNVKSTVNKVSSETN